MPTSLKLAAFAAAVALVFGGALGVGAAVGSPAPVVSAEHEEMTGDDMPGMGGSAPPMAPMPGH